MIDGVAQSAGNPKPCQLAREEEKRTKLRAASLFETGLLDTFSVGTFAGLAQIHHFLFEEVYPFAGKLRTENIAKGQFRFVPVLYLEAALASIDGMPMQTFDEIVEKYVEMNVAHPFREGNGRSMRIWLEQMCQTALGQGIDWSQVEKERYLQAMERSVVHDLEIKTLLQSALTSEIDPKSLYMKGIDASYHIEGYHAFTLEELLKSTPFA